MSNQIVISSGAKVRNLNGVLTGTSGVVDALGINVPSGIPQLDGSGKILVSQLPNSVMEYKGTWNAATNTPTLVNGTGNQGDVYLCNVAGTVNFGAGPITFSVGDQVIYSGTIWQKASGATGTVTSVAVTESGDALSITGSPITTSGTINIGFAGTSGQYVNGAGGLTTFPSLTGFVPYTGATGNVNLGEFGLTSGFVGFDLSPTGTPTGVGTLSWDSAYRTLQLIDGDGDTTLQIGQEQRALIHNNTGATLTDGQVVYVTGSTGNLPTVALASNNLESSSSVTFGVVTETIAHGADGFVTISGTVNGLNTLAYNEGDALYLGSTAGTFTNVKPVAPANLVLIGYMIKKAGGNGSIFVKIQNGYELEELHDVLVTSVANNQGLFWDSATSLWKNKSIATALGYTPLSGTGATNYIPKFTGTTSIGNSSIQELASGLVSISGTTLGELDLIGTSQATLFLGHNSTIDNVIQSSLSSSFNILNTIGASQTYLMYYDYTSKALSFQTNGFNTRLLIDSSGNVGINTASPLYKLDINGTARVSGQLTLGSTITNGTYTYTLPSATGTLALTSDLSSYVPYSGATQNVNLGVYNIELGAVLTNKTANGGLLMKQNTTISAEVSGTNYTSIKPFDTRYLYFDFGQPSSYKSFRIDANGLTNATLRTYTIPDASGTIALTSDIPSLAGYVPYTGATGPVDLGSYDLLVNGVRAGKGGGTGSNNTRFGALAFMANTTGSYNAALGTLTLNANTTGANNTAVGNAALQLNTTGGSNTSVGSFTLSNNTTGVGNVALGTGSLAGITTGSYNIAIGINTANLITTGDFNTIIGNYSGSTNLTSNIILADGAGNVRYQWNGTNNVFGNAVQASAYRLTGMTAGSGALYWTSDRVTLANYNASGILTFEVNGGATALTLASTGAATFSSSVTAVQGIFTATSLPLRIQSTTNYETATLGSATGTMAYVSANGLYGMYVGIGNSGNTWLQSQRNDGNTTAYNLLLNPQGGNVGIGTSSPEAYTNYNTLTIDGTTGSILALKSNGTLIGRFGVNASEQYMLTTGSTPLVFYTNTTERMRITSGGNVGIGTTTVNCKLQVLDGQIGVGSTGSGGQGLYLFINNALSDNSYLSRGSAGSGTTTWYIGNQAITTSSDIRLKENINNTTRVATEIINKIRIVDHSWNDPSDTCINNKNSRGLWMGLIAQEAIEHIPWLVNKPLQDENEDGSKNYWHMDFAYSVPLLMKAIQEQQAQIEELKVLIAAK